MTRPMVRVYLSPEEFVDREMNDDEYKQHEIDKAEYDKARAIIEQEEVENLAKRQSALAKLTALGLTEDEAKAVIGA